MRAIILDIETVPDYTVWFGYTPTEATNGAPNPLAPPEKPKRGRPKANGAEPFAPIWAHAVVCIGVAVFDEGRPAAVQAMGIDKRDDEAALLGALATWLKTDDQLITWNGRGFDLPVLKLRSFRHGVQQPALGDFKRYDGDRHLDMLDVMSDFGVRGVNGYSLDTFARLIGLPGKDGVDGSQVKEMFNKGEHDKIRAYCRRDVVQTAYIWLRNRLLRGQITADEYRDTCALLRKQWQGDEAFASFKVDASRLEMVTA